MEELNKIKEILKQKGFVNIITVYFFYDVKKEHRYQIEYYFPKDSEQLGMGKIFRCRDTKPLSSEEILEKSGLNDYLLELNDSETKQ